VPADRRSPCAFADPLERPQAHPVRGRSQVREHCRGGEAIDADPLLAQPPIAALVVADLTFLIVNCAIDLDSEARRGAEEVENVRAYGVLLAKD
jgi:hypothetical protein